VLARRVSQHQIVWLPMGGGSWCWVRAKSFGKFLRVKWRGDSGRRRYAEDMNTPWEIIISMFAYAFIGWTVLYLIHRQMRCKRKEPRNAQEAAQGYSQSWNTTRSADF
jgi:hypothetical protein